MKNQEGKIAAVLLCLCIAAMAKCGVNATRREQAEMKLRTIERDVDTLETTVRRFDSEDWQQVVPAVRDSVEAMKDAIIAE